MVNFTLKNIRVGDFAPHTLLETQSLYMELIANVYVLIKYSVKFSSWPKSIFLRNR